MSYLFLALLLLALIHFAYESIVAPTFRLQLKQQLFELSEELKLLKQRHQRKDSEKVFHYLQDSVNNLSNTINRFEVVEVARALAKVGKDQELRERLESRVKALDSCDVPEIKALWIKIARRAVKIVEVNSGGWAFYLIPIALFNVCLKKLYQIAKALVSLPSSYLRSFSSDDQGPISLTA